ncbi:hypothetical protein [Streptomyces sp. NPDC088258]|uniref:hypothetical protein n=1 Tax=Streptomyces sp. NPDC088258 TaxID=3365849 RepID=UPI003825587A
MAYKAAQHDLSARMIDVMLWASAQSEDPLLAATAAYVRTEALLAARSYALGLRALEAAIDACPSPVDTAGAAALGALHMRAAVVAGRTKDVDAADMHIAEAGTLAEQVREEVCSGTAFGPDSVRIHEVSLAVSLDGDHNARALAIAREWAPPTSMPRERRSGFYVELARAQLRTDRRQTAFESPAAARSIAPADRSS